MYGEQRSRCFERNSLIPGGARQASGARIRSDCRLLAFGASGVAQRKASRARCEEQLCNDHRLSRLLYFFYFLFFEYFFYLYIFLTVSYWYFEVLFLSFIVFFCPFLRRDFSALVILQFRRARRRGDVFGLLVYFFLLQGNKKRQLQFLRQLDELLQCFTGLRTGWTLAAKKLLKIYEELFTLYFLSS